MKTFTTFKSFFVSLLFIFSFGILLSCSKLDSSANDTSMDGQTSAAGQSSILEESITFCTESTVALCWKKSNLVLGHVKIKRGSDNNLYVTYKASPTFYFMEINLYCGAQNAIPTSFINFPYRKTYTTPFPEQEHTFIVTNLPLSFVIVAEALVVKKASNGNITGDVKQGWANGCDGPNLCLDKKNTCGDLDGGSMITYVDPPNCFIQGPSIAAEPDVCSFPIPTFLGIHPLYNTITAWSVPSVTIGGFSYTEDEARAISDATATTDARIGFRCVTALKLSNTGYMLSPSLAPKVQTIESWLATTGKLSPSNLPSGNTEVKNATNFIINFIDTHTCPWRIE